MCSSNGTEALWKKDRQDESQFTTKIGGQTSGVPSYFVLYNLEFQLHIWFCPIMAKLAILNPWLRDFTDNYIV
jgi:hypothetical protein